MLCVPAPQARCAIDVDESVHVRQPVADASLIRAGAARIAVTARQEHLDRDPIALAHAPASRRPRPDPFDDTDRLVAGNEREAREQLARVLLVVRTAQTARLDPQQPVVVPDRGDRELARVELPRRHEDERASPPDVNQRRGA